MSEHLGHKAERFTSRPTGQAESIGKGKFLQNRFMLLHILPQYKVSTFKLRISPKRRRKKKGDFQLIKLQTELERIKAKVGVLSNGVVNLFIFPVDQSNFIWLKLVTFQYSQHPFHLQRQVKVKAG